MKIFFYSNPFEEVDECRVKGHCLHEEIFMDGIKRFEKNKRMRVCPFCGSQGVHKMDFIGTKEECIDFWNYRNHF